MTFYHCPSCGHRVEKDSFGYPVHCGRTMDKVPEGALTPAVTITPEFTNARLWEMATEVDYHADELNEWETDFIIDMCRYRDERRGYTPKQREHVIRLWEKYCA